MLPQTATREILQLKVVLRGIRPPIWRRLLIPAHRTLADLHDAIQAAFGWGECHLHVFDVLGEEYGPPDPEDEMGTLNERIVIARFGLRPKMRFSYTYDFGDDWVHEISVEKILVPETPLPDPVCLAGRRACPPEDCGGIWGYENLLEAMRNPMHPEHEELVTWLDDEDWDPGAFSLDNANARLETRFAPARARSTQRPTKVRDPQTQE